MSFDQRPVFLNLWRIRFHLPAIVSILHRVSGVLLFLGIPVLLCLLACSGYSEKRFLKVQEWLSASLPKFILFLIAASFLYHLLAGVRHLMMDLGIGESLKAARFSAGLVLLLGIGASVVLGVLLW